MGLWKSEALQGENGPAWKGGDVKLHCEVCGKEFEVKPGLANTARFCSRKCMGLWRTENMRGENSPSWKGGKVKLDCEFCGEEFEVSPSYIDTARFCSPACWGLWQSENRCGENSPTWRGGISLEPYGSEWTEDLREEIRKRDNHTCAISGQPGHHVHHINYNKTDNRPENLITLCISCHGKTNHNREYYKALLSPIAIARTTEMRAKNRTERTTMMENTVYGTLGEFYGGAD